MLNPDEIVETGFAALKNAQPSQRPAELVVRARRQAFRARVNKTAVGVVGCLAIAGMLAVVLQPTSALAALQESVRLTDVQPIVHLHIVNQYFDKHSPTLPLPDHTRVDIWKYRDHYFRRQGHAILELFKDGTYLAYDDRFPGGFKWTYDAQNDPTWTLNGTIGVEVERRHKISPTVKNVFTHGAELIQYEWQNRWGALQNGTTEHIYVDPRSKLIRYAEGDIKNPNGDTDHGDVEFDYPDAPTATREEPHFPEGLKFQTKDELLRELYQRIALPEQTKTLAGVPITLYGVLVCPNITEGILVEAITRGGAKGGAGHPVQILGAPLLAAKRSDWSKQLADPLQARFTRDVVFNLHKYDGHVFDLRRYVGYESNDLLICAPTRITIRIPVWRNRNDFVGYATFKTSKLFFNIGNGYLPYYGDPQPRN